MSKVICDVCGTTFPETASVCPICGSAKVTTTQTAAGDGGEGANFVKGGRFSKRNVKKRNKGKPVPTIAAKQPAQRKKPAEEKQAAEKPAATPRPERRERPDAAPRPERRERPASASYPPRRERPERERKEKTNIGLVILIVLLLIGIVAVMLYIGIKFFLPGSSNNSDPGGTTPPAGVTTEPIVQIPCRTLQLGKLTIELSAKDDGELISVVVSPEDTTDKLIFSSSDEDVATVDQNGKVTAVGGGEAVITVKCGDKEATCTVICSFEPLNPPTDPPQPTDPPVEIPDGFTLKLVYTDISLFKEGENYALFKETSGIKPSDITWTVDDPNVATVDENGRIYAVNRGKTTVRAQIGDLTATCIVRCKFDAAAKTGNYISCLGKQVEDITLMIGETQRLALVNEQGVNLNVTWTVNIDGYIKVDGSKVTGLTTTVGAGVKLIVSCEYEGVTYECRIFVSTKSIS